MGDADLAIHTYGGGKILQKVLMALSVLSGEEGFVTPLMLICSALGFGFFFCKLFGTLIFDHFWMQYFVPFCAIYTLFMIPTTRVEIRDELHKNEIYQVEAVPRLLAHFAEIVSSIGYYVTSGIEKTLDIGHLNYLSGRSLDFKQFPITSLKLKKELREFSKQCLFYDLSLGRYTLDELRNSGDLWDFFKKRTSSLRMVYSCLSENSEYVKGQCKYLSCQQALERLDPLLIKEIEQYEQKDVGKNLPLIFHALTGLKQEKKPLIRQQLLINLLSEQFGSKKEEILQNTFYQTAGPLAYQAVILIRCAFEAMIYFSFLLILPLSLLPSGIKIFIHWAYLVIWIQLWPPLYAILNLITSLFGQSAIAEGHQGLSLLKSLELQNFSCDLLALSGYLTLSVPYVSYLLIRSAMQPLTQFITPSSIASPYQADSAIENSIVHTQYSSSQEISQSALHPLASPAGYYSQNSTSFDCLYENTLENEWQTIESKAETVPNQESNLLRNTQEMEQSSNQPLQEIYSKNFPMMHDHHLKSE